MRNLFVFLIFLFSPTILFASELKVVGNYTGIIWSNSELPGQTNLRIDASGDLKGSYTFGSEEAEQGTLSQCDLHDLILYCIWQDAYGAGDFLVKFSEDFSSFEGQWFDTVGVTKKSKFQRGYTWTGHKTKLQQI